LHLNPLKPVSEAPQKKCVSKSQSQSQYFSYQQLSRYAMGWGEYQGYRGTYLNDDGIV